MESGCSSHKAIVPRLTMLSSIRIAKPIRLISLSLMPFIQSSPQPPHQIPNSTSSRPLARTSPGTSRSRISQLRRAHWRCPEFCFNASCVNPNRRVFDHVSVPLRVRTLDRQEVQLLSFRHEPNWNRDRASRFPADQADLDLAIAGEAAFEGAVRAMRCGGSFDQNGTSAFQMRDCL